MARRSPALALAALVLPVLLISIDMTVLGAALPVLAEDLDPGAAEQLWIVDAYSFVLAGLLVTMGTLGDRVGRRRLLMCGAAAFGVASVLAAFAPTAGTLVVARALLGLGGATLMPSTFSLIKTTFPEPRRRATAVARVVGRVLRRRGGGSRGRGRAARALLVGLGLPDQRPRDRAAAGGRAVRPAREPGPAPGPVRPRLGGAVARRDVPAGLGAQDRRDRGPDRRGGASAVVGVAAGTLFVRRQRRLAHPLLDLGLFSRPSFSVSVTTNLLGVFALVGLLLLLPQYLQSVLGYSPLEAALWMLPGSVAGVTGALLATRLARRLTRPALVGVGLGSAATGLAVVAVLGGLAGVVVGFALLGAGVALSEALTNDLILAAAPADRAGAASAISETGYELGGALGTAVLGSLAAAVFTARTGQETLGGALADAGALDPGAGDALVTASREAFVVGLQGAAALVPRSWR